MTAIVRIPITNVLAGGDYTGTFEIGTAKKKVNVLLDTGSSTLAVHAAAYNPKDDASAQPSKLLQVVQYGSGSWSGPVVFTDVTVGAAQAGSQAVKMSNVAVAVATQESQHMFNGFDGILGLAYQPLDDAYQLQKDTWPGPLTQHDLSNATRTFVEPYFSELERQKFVADKFAFYTRRSFTRVSSGDPAQDPMNQGWLILGGGEEASDLYSGAFQTVRVVADAWFNINLKSVRVGTAAPVTVKPVTMGSSQKSNAILDSGTQTMVFNQALWTKIVHAFNSLNPAFATAIHARQVPDGQLDLTKWPPVAVVVEGMNGDVTLTLKPETYWQVDAWQKGVTILAMGGDHNTLKGQSILGLPLMNNYFVVHDRTANGGIGTIKFATMK